MPRLILRNALRIVTMDDTRRELSDADILVEDGVIRSVAPAGSAAPGEAEVIDASGCVVTPGLVNTHHHLYQYADPGGAGRPGRAALRLAEDALSDLGALRPEEMFVSAQLGLAELALSGCTMSSDHLYLFPNGVAARGHDRGGADDRRALPPDARRDERRRERRRPAARRLVEREADILADMIRVVDAFHDPRPRRWSASGSRPARPSRSRPG